MSSRNLQSAICNLPSSDQNMLPCRYLSQPSLTFSSPGSALAALAAAHKFLCCGLAEVAGRYLTARLSQANVLAVVSELVERCPQEAGGHREGGPVVSPPPAPPPPLSVCCRDLRAASLAFLDRNITTITGNITLPSIILPITGNLFY